ncbi:MAG: ATP-binding cassette domain-containing protein [Bacteroidota bacterium]
MSEQILEALMQLFAIIASPESNREDRRTVVESFLSRQLNHEVVKEYLQVFDHFYTIYQEKEKDKKAISADSVKVLRICTEINRALEQSQKFIVLIQLLEFVKTKTGEINRQEQEFVDTVAETFNISRDEYLQIKKFVLFEKQQVPDSSAILIINSKEPSKLHLQTKHMQVPGLYGELRVLNVASTNMYFILYLGGKEMNLNGQLIEKEKVYAFTTGSSIRNPQITPIYYSDVVSRFAEDKIRSKILFEVEDIEFRFKSGKTGLHSMSFTEHSGRLVGIMGASGAGKSTLLNVLNGSVKPTSGSVKINGFNIHAEEKEIEGIIGHVSQDDFLIEELTVFQNLYYNAKLCFDNYSEEQLLDSVHRVLKNLGLYEIKDVQVGSPLNKKISGGQRKRLNIALELLREPAVLFLDEPTSGLSSRDSENIMDLLKELALKGKLVFVVIHQPSSDLFKMFDKLLILDTGGYLIYNGNPVESIVYFKERVHHANWNESECECCGNVNPEQIFNIVEASVIDEYGKPTDTRKISPYEWRQKFTEKKKADPPEKKMKATEEDLPEISFKTPGKLKQFWIFAKRDILKKLSDKQYLAINFLEAPVLAFLLAFIIKYYDVDISNEYGYTLYGNSNLPVYLFMAVIVAIFMGLTVSAEEIIKDRKILKREAFLNLSWSGYLHSKIFVQFVLAAIQSATFVLIGNAILEIKGMFFIYWIVLFSAWTSANLMGLLISDSFKNVVTIYILIPFLVIPQIILSGIIVNFEKLNPQISSPKSIPFYGEIITARWAYEALATYQYIENDYQKRYYSREKLLRNASFKENFLIRELLNKARFIEKHIKEEQAEEKIAYNLNLLRKEIEQEYHYRMQLAEEQSGVLTERFVFLEKLAPKDMNEEIIAATILYLEKIQSFYSSVYSYIYKKLNEQKRSENEEWIAELKRKHHNENLEELVTNKNEFERIVEYKGELIQKKDPIYLDPVNQLIKAHFYAPRKLVFGNYISTIWVNVSILWLFTITLFIALYYRVLKRFMDFIEDLKIRKK